jgi:hypothetical protein
MHTESVMTYATESDCPSFDSNEEQWFEAQPAKRPSQRPTRPAPSMPPPSLDDSIADGWFFDV